MLLNSLIIFLFESEKFKCLPVSCLGVRMWLALLRIKNGSRGKQLACVSVGVTPDFLDLNRQL